MPFTKDNIEEVRKTYKEILGFDANISVLRNELVESMHEYFFREENKRSQALIMVSGGKDSTVALGLACEAIGESNVYAVTAPFENDTSDILKTSLEVINYFDIPKKNIIHSPIKLNSKDSIVNNSKDAIQDGVTGRYYEEVLSWDKTKPEDRNLAARIRMLKAYYFAQRFNARVINTSNFSENIAGWFTKWGDCVGDYYPLKRLTASEVVMVGLEMGIPEKFMFRTPDDGLIGTSDEEALGFTYNELDKEIWTIREKRKFDDVESILYLYKDFENLPEKMLNRFKSAFHKRFKQ